MSRLLDWNDLGFCYAGRRRRFSLALLLILLFYCEVMVLMMIFVDDGQHPSVARSKPTSRFGGRNSNGIGFSNEGMYRKTG